MPFDIYTPSYASSSIRYTIPVSIQYNYPVFISVLNFKTNPQPSFPLLFVVKTTVHVYMRQRVMIDAPSVNPFPNDFLTSNGLLTVTSGNYQPLVYSPFTTPNHQNFLEDIETDDCGVSLAPNVYWPITINSSKENVLMFYNSDVNRGATNTTAPIITIMCTSDLTLNGPTPGSSYSIGWI